VTIKYRDLVQFDPIESVVQLRAADERAEAGRLTTSTFVQVAQRLPASVLQEDPGLLMYYDNAPMREEQESGQERLL
jgi:hypothetical protein